MIEAVTLPSVPEIRYLIARLLLAPIVRTGFILAWSRSVEATASGKSRQRPSKAPKPGIATVVLERDDACGNRRSDFRIG